jgi:hypothetical protein
MALLPKDPRAQVPPEPAVNIGMDIENATSIAFRNVVKAADSTLELICRLRGITLDNLSDEELNAFFLHALGDEFFLPPENQ